MGSLQIFLLVYEIKTFFSNFSGLKIFDKQNLQILVIEEVLKYLKIQRLLQIKVCGHITKCSGLKVRSCTRLGKFTIFLSLTVR